MRFWSDAIAIDTKLGNKDCSRLCTVAAGGRQRVQKLLKHGPNVICLPCLQPHIDGGIVYFIVGSALEQLQRHLRFSDWPHPEACEDLAQVSGGFDATPMAVSDNSGRLAAPLMEEVVEGIFQSRWDRPVVLGRDEDKGIELPHPRRPRPRVRVRVVWCRIICGPAAGDHGFVV